MGALGSATVTQNVWKWETVVPIFKVIAKVSGLSVPFYGKFYKCTRVNKLMSMFCHLLKS